MRDHQGLELLIERYEAVKVQLDAAMEYEDYDAVQKLDKALVSAFNRVFLHEPQSKSELLGLCEFLLNQVQSLDGKSALKQKMVTRILELIDLNVPKKTWFRDR